MATAPEPLNHIRDEKSEPKPFDLVFIEKPDLKQRITKKWRILASIGLIVFLAVVTGVVLGVTLTSQRSNHSGTASTMPVPTYSGSMTENPTSTIVSVITESGEWSSDVNPSSTVDFTLPTTSPPVPAREVPECNPGQKVVDVDGVLSCADGNYSTQDGSQYGDPVISWQCLGRPDVPAEVLDIAYVYYVDKYYNGTWHDFNDRTGIWSRNSAHVKSRFFTTLMNNNYINHCRVAGHVVNGVWQEDDQYPVVTYFSRFVGPLDGALEFTVVPVPEEICPPSSDACCLPRVVNPSASGKVPYLDSFGRFAISFQRLCAPVYDFSPPHIACTNESTYEPLQTLPYLQNCYNGIGTREHPKNHSYDYFSTCNCIHCPEGPGCTEWSGDGADCSAVAPGGAYFQKWDLYASFAYSANMHYQKTGLCGVSYDKLKGVDVLELCRPEGDPTKCLINQDTSQQTSWVRWRPSGFR